MQRNPKKPVAAVADATDADDDDVPDSPGTVLYSQATPKQIADYLSLCNKTQSGITDALHILELRRQNPNTPADELRYINAQYGDQIAKKGRVSAMEDAFVANSRAMRPPTPEMMNNAVNLLNVLDDMTANNTTAEQAIVTATQLFKTWRNTEVS